MATEFMLPIEDSDCNSGYGLKLGVRYSAAIITFEKLELLLGFSWQAGWMCVNMQTGHYYGQIDGTFTGGTGRFAAATGKWVTDFEGINMEPLDLIPDRASFRSFSGVVNGDVDLHDTD